MDGRRICEEFQILVNGDDLHVTEPVFDSSCKVNGIRRSLLVERTASRALLQLPPSTVNHRDLWLVCRVDRVLSADTQAELYMKSSSDPKAVAKLQKTISMSMTRLAGHRQRFAWTAKPLFPELRNDSYPSTLSTSSSTSPIPPSSTTSTLSGWSRSGADQLQLFRCESNRYSDADSQKSLLEFSKLEKQSKMIVPNASISISLNTRANVLNYLNRVNPSLYPLNPWKPEEANAPPVFQLQTFGDQPNQPHTSLTNLLYIYPLGLKYDSQKAFSKARNISCTVRFVRGEEAIPEKAMVDRMSAAGPYCISSTCSVQHHQQNPVFGEEMKTQLPLNLTTSDHLLFSFSHISVAGNSNLKASESTETPIGYSCLPLVWKKDRLMLESDEQEFALPVAIDLPSHYYRTKPTGKMGKGEESASEVRWVDQKPLFRVRLRLVSSVFTTDFKLQSFFQACDRLSAKGIIGDAADSLKRMVKSKSSSPPSDLLSQHPRSCSPIADSMQRSMSLEDADQHLHMKHLLQTIRLLSDVPFDRLLVYLPIVLGRLFAILPQAPTDQLAIATMRSIIGEEDMNASGSTNSIAFRVLQLVNLSQEVALNVLDVAQTFAHQLASSQRHRHWPHSFDLVVLDLLRQLRGVMPATVALKDAANDPIRLADLHLQLADSYRGSAALRSPWFDTLAELYEQDRWFAEASVCHAHSVAIIARELEEKKELEVDWRNFNWINNQIAETEQSLGGDAGNVQPAGSRAVVPFDCAGVGEEYFTSLVIVYAELQQTYRRAAEVRSSGKRHLGAYFRVRFYGEQHFRQEHNTDWIYREVGLTSLATISLEIKAKCQRQVGHERVQIEANEQLNLAKIDPTEAYVQITHVEPSSSDRPTSSASPVANDFLVHTNLCEFSYGIAMIENDRKLSREPAIHEQSLKRTIIKVNSGGFPSTRRRLPVTSVHYEQFSPLEFACQKLNTKAEQIRKTLSAASNGRRLDVKGLQLLLQGAVLPTVNAGPLSYAEVFTKDYQQEKYGEDAIVKLRESFRNLMNACQLAIEANASAIGSDQQTYHEVLVSSFDAMHEKLQTFFGASLRGNLEPDGPSQLPRSATHILDMMGGVIN
ncbi:unnamed protein product [Caenorhabditis brenneri]